MSEMGAMKTLLAVRDYGSLTQAAEQLQEPKSTLSRRLAILESQLGYRLTCQVGRRLSLTRAGQCYAGYAEQILELANAGQQALKSMSTRLSGSVCISLCPELSHGWSTETLNQFCQHYPDIDLDIRVQDCAEHLHDPDVDLLVSCCGCPSNSSPARCKALACWSQGLYMSVKQKDEILPEQLEQQVWIVAPDTADIICLHQPSGLHQPIHPHKRMRISAMQMRVDAIAQGYGIGLLPCWIGECRRHGLKTLKRILPQWEGTRILLQLHSRPERWTPAVNTLQDWLIQQVPIRWQIR